MTKEELQQRAAHHDYEARGANEIRRKFESGDFLVAGYAKDHDEWTAQMITLHSQLEAQHLKFRDMYLERLATIAE